jgi:hypothetical protein
MTRQYQKNGLVLGVLVMHTARVKRCGLLVMGQVSHFDEAHERGLDAGKERLVWDKRRKMRNNN